MKLKHDAHITKLCQTPLVCEYLKAKNGFMFLKPTSIMLAFGEVLSQSGLLWHKAINTLEHQHCQLFLMYLCVHHKKMMSGNANFAHLCCRKFMLFCISFRGIYLSRTSLYNNGKISIATSQTVQHIPQIIHRQIAKVSNLYNSSNIRWKVNINTILIIYCFMFWGTLKCRRPKVQDLQQQHQIRLDVRQWKCEID